MEGMGGAYVKRLTYNYDSKESTGSMYVHEVTREQFKETTHVSSIKSCEHAVTTHSAQVENSITLVNGCP